MSRRALTTEELLSEGRIDLEPGPWLLVDQERIDTFADATGDHQWIHVDPERAKAGPFGTTIAHGYLLLSLLPRLLADLFEISDERMSINYGTEKIRFTSPVPAGSQVRVKASIAAASRRKEAVQYQVEVELQVEGEDRPALVGEVVYLTYQSL